MIFEELGGFVLSLEDHDERRRAFGGIPSLQFAEVPFNYDTGPVAAFEVRLLLTDADDPDVSVSVAFADALLVALDCDEDISVFLDKMHLANHDTRDAALLPGFWSEFFDWDELSTAEGGGPLSLVGFPNQGPPVGTVLIIRDVFVDEAFRGHRLGALLVGAFARAFNEERMPGEMLLLGFPRFGRRAMTAPDVGMQEAARSYWSEALNLTSLDHGIYGVFAGGTPLADALARLETALTAGYVKVDISSLRERLGNGDPTLWPRSRGILPSICPGHAEDADAEFDDELADAHREFAGMARVFQSIEDHHFPNASVQVATIVRFYGDQQASVFGDAFAYLRTNPDFDVRSVAVYFDEESMMHCLVLTVCAEGV
ncbi:MAG: hypothetical protein U0Q47_12215 [Mycobacterium sp.]